MVNHTPDQELSIVERVLNFGTVKVGYADLFAIYNASPKKTRPSSGPFSLYHSLVSCCRRLDTRRLFMEYCTFIRSGRWYTESLVRPPGFCVFREIQSLSTRTSSITPALAPVQLTNDRNDDDDLDYEWDVRGTRYLRQLEAKTNALLALGSPYQWHS